MTTHNLQTITLGMGCFWSPDALFGQLAGVQRTRVGYAGGMQENPTYHQMGDHTETVELDFDPGKLALEEILHVFWEHHNPFNINDYKGRQYKSIVLYRDEAQRNAVQAVIEQREQQGQGRPDTEIAPFRAFYPAEERHQKYYLKRFPDSLDKLSTLCSTPEELTNSTLAARLNGLAKGYANLEQIAREVADWPISEEKRHELLELIRKIKW